MVEDPHMEKDAADDFQDALDLGVPEIEVEDDLDRVLRGAVVTKSYEGTSQYSHKGISACGLASFNAVRCVLAAETRGAQGAVLIRAMLSRDMVERAIAICSMWPSATHLDPEDIYKFGIFSAALKPISANYSPADVRSFKTMLQRLRALTSSNGQVAAAVITKPPEILAVFAVTTKETKPRPSVVYAVFDSHSRPVEHPYGAAFSFFGDPDIAAEYLASLLSFDTSVFAETAMQWQAQLMSQFSAHIYVAETAGSPKADLDMELFKANIATLEARSEVEQLRTTLSQMQTNHARLLSENQNLKYDVRDLRIRLSQLRSDLDGKGESARDAESKKGKEKDTGFSIPNPISIISDYWSNGPTPAESRKVQESQRLHKHSRREGASGSRLCSSTNKVGENEQRGHPNKQGATDNIEDDQLVAAKMYFEEQKQAAPGLDQEGLDQSIRDAQLAAKLQREWDTANDVLMEQHYTLLSNAQRTFLCAVCMEKCPEDVLANVDGCDHVFCRECLTGYVKSSLEQNKFPIICPSCLIDEKRSEDEKGVVSQVVLEILGISEEDFKRWVSFGLEGVSILMDCRRCRTTTLVDKGDHDAAQILACPLCRYMWCKKCQQPVASPVAADHSCDGTKELDKLMLANGWKNCPGCQTPTEKTFGCNHMTCPARGCNTHFCYIDGQLICKNVTGPSARDKVKQHYSSCKLFDYPDER